MLKIEMAIGQGERSFFIAIFDIIRSERIDRNAYPEVSCEAKHERRYCVLSFDCFCVAF